MSQLEAFATISTTPFFVNLTALGTTPTRIVLQQQVPDGATFVNRRINSPAIARCRIYNLHATNHVAITVVDESVDAPNVWNSTSGGTVASPATPTGGSAGLPQTMTCGAAGALNTTDGIRIAPGTTLEINLKPHERIWVVASAASTPVQLVWFAQNG